MSSFKRRNRNKSPRQSLIGGKGYVSSYVKQGTKKAKEVQKALESLCGDSSSSDERLPALRLSPLTTCRVDLNKKAKQAATSSTTKASQNNKSLLSLEEDISLIPSDDNSMSDKRKKTRSSVSSKDTMAKKSQRRKCYLSSDSKSSESDDNKQKALSKTNAKGKNTVNNVRKKRNESKDPEDSDSDHNIFDKSTENKEKRHVKFLKQNIVELVKEDGESSSGKEFQKSKLSRDCSIVVRKLSESIGNHSKPKKPSPTSTKHGEENTMISKEQSLNFKSRVIKTLNRFKDVCSEYELHMERVKCKYFKKKLMYRESAKNVINKSKDVIVRLRTELDAQEKELTDFYEEWHKNCTSENTSQENSSFSESDVAQTTHDAMKRKSPSEKENVVSDCESKKIFSEDESIETNIKENKKDKDPPLDETEKVVDKVVEDDNNEDASSAEDNAVASPILGNKKKKEASSEVHSKDKSGRIGIKEVGSTKSEEDENEHDKNDSSEDMFETSVENIEATDTSKVNDDEFEEQNNLGSKKVNNEESENTKSDSNTKENLVKNGELNVEPDNEDLNTDGGTSIMPKPVISPKVKSKSDTESRATAKIKTTDDNCSDKPNEEEKAKKALLDSDSDTLVTEESMSENSNRVSITDNPPEKCASKLEPLKCGKKGQKDEENTDSACKGGSLEEQDKVTKAEHCAKRALRESNSDDTATLSATKSATSDKKHESDNRSKDVRAKAKLLVSSNSESSSSDNEDKLNFKKIEASLDKLEKNTDLDVSVNEKAKKRRIDLKKICDSQSDEKLRTDCHVFIERLPQEDLKNYANALQKSRQYLEDKKIKSLIDLDRLAKCQSRASDSAQSITPKKKAKAAKEEEDSLLNHLKKVENGEFDKNLERDSSSDSINAIEEPQIAFSTNEELMKEADMVAKNMLLNSDSDIGEQKAASESSESEPKKSNAEEEDDTEKSVRKQQKKKNAPASDKTKDDDEREKSSWRRDKLLTTKFSESDSDAQRKEWNEKQRKLQKMADESDTEHSDANDTGIKRKKRIRRKILNSDSDKEMLNSDSDSDKSIIIQDEASSDSTAGKKKRRKRKARKSSDTDSSVTEKRPKSKRRRIKNLDTDSDESTDNDQITNSQGTPGKKGRKNIRRMIKDKQVADDTKQAAKEEEERMKRIDERQKLYNEMYEARLASEEKVESLVLDFDPETKKELISVHQDLVKRLKPHQAKGIKFMWDACFESLERIKNSSGSGCIIAHCMGLGKTLQVIALIHTLLRHEETGMKSIMIVSPLSTVLNWVNEFNLWLNNIEDGDFEVYEMTKLKKNVDRKYQLESWQKTGGVLIIGYEMFRNLSGTNNKMRKNMKEAILKYLIDPGPDMIVCDEGHLLKNEDTALSKSITRIKTLRRIILTGTPLQNNLIEYHCMVQFIKPRLLGTKKEFLNRFVNPITNGQFDDSTESDVKLMKKRAYVLHKMLKGCVQRFDYSVLMPFLPPKQEYVIFVRLTEVQINLYQHYLDNWARRLRVASGALFADYQALQRIWTHPLVLRLNAEKMDKINEKKFRSSDDSEGSLRDFIHDSDTQTTEDSSSSSVSNSSDDDDVKNTEPASTNDTKKDNDTGTILRFYELPANVISMPIILSSYLDIEELSKPEEIEKNKDDWWFQFVQPDDYKDLRLSGKLLLLFGILKECEQIGDKVLIFSQSLYSLTLIETFLEIIDDETQHGESSELIEGHTGQWRLGLDYFRLDGKTSAENRNKWCKIFNRPTNTRARLFLISTRAGGLGINLTAANRVIIFDASWNPSHDVQSIFRIYRFGQKKPCYIYRFLAAGTMEEKIYNRQVTKLSLSCRVVDEQQIERHYSNHDLNELYNFDLYTNANAERPTLNLPKDRLLADIFLKYKNSVENYHEHDSLLENKAEEKLDEEERKQAWLEYEEEKKGKPMITAYPTYLPISSNIMGNQYNLTSQMYGSTDYEKLQQLIRKDYPNATPEAQKIMTARVLTDMYSYWEQQTYHNTANRLPTQNAGMMQSPMGMQVPNLARMLPVTPNTNDASGQARNELPRNDKNVTKSKDRDDDIVEISPPAVANKSKDQEE
ncbi:uncharacterized protein LOC143375529 isoform X2 [Andrena cerasifolii]|uniref:uncharacterized protein LOC143375529 isoform X2 n=1 Tax=Andrena cerasifolii TaxID=2819439 RepID=UPI004037C266